MARKNNARRDDYAAMSIIRVFLLLVAIGGAVSALMGGVIEPGVNTGRQASGEIDLGAGQQATLPILPLCGFGFSIVLVTFVAAGMQRAREDNRTMRDAEQKASAKPVVTVSDPKVKTIAVQPGMPAPSGSSRMVFGDGRAELDRTSRKLTPAEAAWIERHSQAREMTGSDIEELRRSNPVRASDVSRKQKRAHEKAEMDAAGITPETQALLKHHRMRTRLGRGAR